MDTTFKYLKLFCIALMGMALLAATLAVQAGETVTYVQTDIQGNPVTKTDSSGKVIWRQSYAPYGRTYQQTDPDGPGYTGHRHDTATGLVYMQARYYDPKIGRFLSPDPVTFSPEQPDHFNLYWYANGNPVKYTDPDGRETGRTLQAEWRMMGAKPNLTPGPAGKVIADATLGIVALPVAYLIAPEAFISEASIDELEDGAMITRYMGPEEAKLAKRIGNIPNFGKDKIPRPTHVTTDKPLSNAAEAKAKYELPEIPSHRATVPASRVSDLGKTPDGRNVTSGGGVQRATNQPIPVKPKEIKPLIH